MSQRRPLTTGYAEQTGELTCLPTATTLPRQTPAAAPVAKPALTLTERMSLATWGDLGLKVLS